MERAREIANWTPQETLEHLAEMSLMMAPGTTSLIMATLGSIENHEIKFMPTQEQIEDAVTLDIIYGLLMAIAQKIRDDAQKGSEK